MVNVIMHSSSIASHDISFILSLMKTCTDLAIRMDEFKRFDGADALIDLSHATALALFRRRPTEQADNTVRLQEGCLVSSCSSASSHFLLCGRTEAAQEARHCRTSGTSSTTLPPST